jgi:ABC-type long-subunit fatty acid transport system fused permease/ATPase subunit
LFNAWPTIIELASVYKRLREFERQIDSMHELEKEKMDI